MNRYKNMAIQAKASMWYIICNFLQKGISFITVPIYIRLLTTGEYGEWSVFQAWRDILIIFASLNLYCGVYTKALVDNEKDRDGYTSSMQGLGTVVSLCLLGIYCLNHNWINRLMGLSTPYMLLLFAYFIVYPAFSFWTTRQRVEYRYKQMVAVTILISILTPTISIILLRKTELRTNALIIGFLIVQCTLGFIFYVYHFYKGRYFINLQYWKYAIKYNIPLIPHYVSLIVLGQSDRIMIEYFCGESDAGIYSFAYQIASTISVFISAINGSRVPWTYEKLKEKSYDDLKRITNALVLLMVSIVVILSCMTPDIIGIIGTDDYQDAVLVIPVVVLGVYYTFVYDLYASIEFYYGATIYVMIASVIGAVLNLGLNALFIPQFGYIAAAYTTLVCYFVFFVMHYFFARKIAIKQGIKQAIYDNARVFGLSGLVSIAVFSSILFFSHTVLRNVVVCVIVLIFLLRKDKIYRIFASIRR